MSAAGGGFVFWSIACGGLGGVLVWWRWWGVGVVEVVGCSLWFEVFFGIRSVCGLISGSVAMVCG